MSWCAQGCSPASARGNLRWVKKEPSSRIFPAKSKFFIPKSKRNCPTSTCASGIVRPLVSEAPTQVIDGIPTVTIEKLLIDVFADDILFSAQQGSEMDHIFREAFEKYTINENRMLRYADRRRKKESVDEYLDKFPNSGSKPHKVPFYSKR